MAKLYRDGCSVYGTIGDKRIAIKVHAHDSMEISINYLDHGEIQDLIDRLHDFEASKSELAA